MKAKTSPKLKQKLMLQYVATGIVLALIVGGGVFIYLNLGNRTDSKAATGNKFSKNNYTGLWTNNNSWTTNPAPGTTNITLNIDISGYITHVGNISFASGASATLTITDTLVIDGNLVMGNKSDIVVGNGGVLVVTGDFTAENKIILDNGGVIAIGGNMTFPNNSQDTYTGTGGELFVLGTVSGNTTASGAQQGEGALQNKYPNLANFLNGSATTLPIILSYFKAQAQEGKVVTEWATDQEIDNDFFTIERSTNGKEFEVVGTLPGAGNSSVQKMYTFTDNAPLSGASFYRLKQTDFDGKFAYSSIVALTMQPQAVESNSTLTVISVAPNPFEKSFYVEFELTAAGLIEARLTNLQGHIVAFETMEGATGNNRHTFQDTDGLPSGTYLLSLIQRQSGGERSASKAMRVIKK